MHTLSVYMDQLSSGVMNAWNAGHVQGIDEGIAVRYGEHQAQHVKTRVSSTSQTLQHVSETLKHSVVRSVSLQSAAQVSLVG